MCFALLYLLGICNTKVNRFRYFPFRHQLEILLGDHLLPYNMTVYQAIKQFGQVRLIFWVQTLFYFLKRRFLVCLFYIYIYIYMDLSPNEFFFSFSVMKTKTLMTNKVSWADRVFGFQHTPYGKCVTVLERLSARRFWATTKTGSEDLACQDGGLSQVFKLIVSTIEKVLQ